MKRLLSLMLVLLSTTALLYTQDVAESDARIVKIIEASDPQIIQQVEMVDYSARVTVYPCVTVEGQSMSYERLDLINLSTQETHAIEEQLLNCEGLGATGLSIVHWTEMGEFLYFTDAREGLPDGLTTGWTRPLWRLRIEDLQVEPLGQAKFSHDMTHLVAWDSTQIRVFSDDTMIGEYPLLPENLTITDVTWLPDASGILYIQADSPMGGTRSAVTHIDLETLEQTVLLDTAE